MTPTLLAGLATSHKIGLALMAGAFIVFALVSALLIPRSRPDFPSGRSLGVFVLVSVLFFLGTMTAVFTLGKESEEEAHAALTETSAESDTTGETGTEATTEEAGQGLETQENQPATTSAGNAATATITVKGTEFKLALDKQPTGPGNYEFVFENDGAIEHDLVVSGPEVDTAKTPVIGKGETAKLRVALVAGEYKLYCDVPGHEAAGMKTTVEIS